MSIYQVVRGKNSKQKYLDEPRVNALVEYHEYDIGF
jgi:hypothetical protein